MATTMTKAAKSGSKQARLTLEDMDHLSTGKKTRLHRLLYDHGPGNGTMMFLPIDQGLEHGPVDFFDNPDAEDPEFQCKLAIEAGYSAIVFHIGLAKKYIHRHAGHVPLVLKLNGKTNVPPDHASFSTLTGTVEDAVRLGADAIGYTLYVGSPAQDRDFEQFSRVRLECDRYGMPVIVWAYPRGEFIEKKGGKDSLYAIDYAARVACELGADVVKINYPSMSNPKKGDSPKPYNTLDMSFEEAVRKVVRSAGRTMVLFSGGSKVSDTELYDMVRIGLDAGGTGIIFGRNMWQRPMAEALQVSAKVKDLMRGY